MGDVADTAAPLVTVERDGPVALLRLNRPRKLNALSGALEQELDAALADPAVRSSSCVIVTGDERAFSAGADVSEMRAVDPAGILDYYRSTGGVYERVADLPQPTIAAISGWCLGGGLELALATDLRIADPAATFGLPEVGIGIVPSSGGLFRLVRAVGPARAKELVLTSRRFDAQEALALGIVSELAPPGQALARARELGAELTRHPPLALSVAKQAIDAIADSPRDAALAIERLAYGLLAQTHDAREAASAFVERREPDFRGG